MKNVVFLILLLFGGFCLAQEEPVDTIVRRLQVYDGVSVSNNFNAEYRNTLQRAKKVYPLALEAARIIDSLDLALAAAKNKRQERKIMKATKTYVKEDFKFLLKDLYVSEGQVLTKLVYRETGMTVNDILKKYGNGMQAFFYSGMAGLFEQDLKATYAPEGEDFVLECVVQDLRSGVVPFDEHVSPMDKRAYKASMKEYRQQKRTNRIKNRKRKREQRKQQPKPIKKK